MENRDRGAESVGVEDGVDGLGATGIVVKVGALGSNLLLFASLEAS